MKSITDNQRAGPASKKVPEEVTDYEEATLGIGGRDGRLFHAAGGRELVGDSHGHNLQSHAEPPGTYAQVRHSLRRWGLRIGHLRREVCEVRQSRRPESAGPLKASKKDDNLKATVTGTLEGDTLKVATVTLD
jgi:hypothetical protein